MSTLRALRIAGVTALCTIYISASHAQVPECPDPQTLDASPATKVKNIYSQRCDHILLSVRQKIEEYSRGLGTDEKKEFNACLSSIASVGAGVADQESESSQAVYRSFAKLNCVSRFSTCISALGRVFQPSCLEKILRIGGTLEPQPTPVPTPRPLPRSFR